MQNHVEGTIAHSFDREKMINYLPFPYPNTPQGRDSAGIFLKNPLAKTEAHMAEGKRLYDIYCAVCHGKTGAGDGSVVKLLTDKRDNPTLTPTAYNTDPIKSYSEGLIFYTTQYGKNNMGPYNTQLSAYERWQVVMYVQTLQGGGTSADSTQTTVAQ